MKGIAVCKICAENKEKNVHFFCPVDGLVHQSMVNFLCNNCRREEMIYKDGMYICPKCLTEGNSFQCRICDSTEVSFIKPDVKND